MRILGVTIPDEKRLEISLTAVYGIGRSRAKDLLDKVGIDYGKRAKELTADDVLDGGAKVAVDIIVIAQFLDREARLEPEAAGPLASLILRSGGHVSPCLLCHRCGTPWAVVHRTTGRGASDPAELPTGHFPHRAARRIPS